MMSILIILRWLCHNHNTRSTRNPSAAALLLLLLEWIHAAACGLIA